MNVGLVVEGKEAHHVPTDDTIDLGFAKWRYQNGYSALTDRSSLSSRAENDDSNVVGEMVRCSAVIRDAKNACLARWRQSQGINDGGIKHRMAGSRIQHKPDRNGGGGWQSGCNQGSNSPSTCCDQTLRNDPRCGDREPDYRHRGTNRVTKVPWPGASIFVTMNEFRPKRVYPSPIAIS
ncbi:hypothetical protein BH09SUM1_BH09SUM1_00070 [soil metagenome]